MIQLRNHSSEYFILVSFFSLVIMSLNTHTRAHMHTHTQTLTFFKNVMRFRIGFFFLLQNQKVFPFSYLSFALLSYNVLSFPSLLLSFPSLPFPFLSSVFSVFLNKHFNMFFHLLKQILSVMFYIRSFDCCLF